MKKIISLFLLAVNANAQINVGPLSDYSVCEENADGYATFYLSMFSDAAALGDLDAAEYSVTYHETFIMAENNTDPLPDVYMNILAYQQTIYVRVTENTNSDNFGIGLFNLIVESAPETNTPTPYNLCNEVLPNDGISTFDLTSKINEIASGCPECTITFYESGDFETPIANPNVYSNTFNPQTVYVSVASALTGCTGVTTLTLRVLPLPEEYNFPVLAQCEAPFDLTANSVLIDPVYSYSYYTAIEDAELGINAIANPQMYDAQTSSSIWVRIEAPTTNPMDPICYTINEQELVIYSEATFDFSTQNQTVTIVPSYAGDYTYAIDSGEPQSSPVFENVAYGLHNFMIIDPCGNVNMYTFMFNPPAPSGETEQTLPEGATLADIEVSGENIQWYINPGINGMGGDTPLPLDMTLTNGATYHASQTINGAESEERLGVTVNLVLDTRDHAFAKLYYYPNPVHDAITITNDVEITDIAISNLLGQQVVTTAINSTSARVDLSALVQGVYLLTITSVDKQKTVKIIRN